MHGAGSQTDVGVAISDERARQKLQQMFAQVEADWSRTDGDNALQATSSMTRAELAAAAKAHREELARALREANAEIRSRLNQVVAHEAEESLYELRWGSWRRRWQRLHEEIFGPEEEKRRREMVRRSAAKAAKSRRAREAEAQRLEAEAAEQERVEREKREAEEEALRLEVEELQLSLIHI